MNFNRYGYFLLLLAVAVSLGVPDPLTMWIVLINALTLIMYGADKLAACKNGYRVPERALLIFGLLGGWLGAILAQRLFRHKTQKQPFKTYFALSVVLNLTLVLAGWYGIYYYR